MLSALPLRTLLRSGLEGATLRACSYLLWKTSGGSESLRAPIMITLNVSVFTIYILSCSRIVCSGESFNRF